MKKNIFKNRVLSILFSACSIGVMVSCNNDDNRADDITPTETIERYSFTTIKGTFPNMASYLNSSTKLGDEKITGANAKELGYISSTMVGFKEHIYISKFGNPATITKYGYDKSGTPVELGKFVDPSSNVMSSIIIVSETEAYAANAGNSSYKIFKFNPTTMQKVGEVDMTLLQKTDPNIKQIMLQGLVKRGDKLYTAVNYAGAAYEEPAIKSAFVAVVDLNQMKVTKLLEDNRTTRVLGGGNTLKLDENTGNIYLMVDGIDGDNNYPNAILRIKNGEDAIDPNYFFNLREATNGSVCTNLMIYDADKALSLKAIDPSDPFELQGKPNYQYYKIDLQNKKILSAISGLPNVFGSKSSFLIKENSSNYLLNVASSDESTLYNFNPKTENITKRTVFEGQVDNLFIHK